MVRHGRTIVAPLPMTWWKHVFCNEDWLWGEKARGTGSSSPKAILLTYSGMTLSVL